MALSLTRCWVEGILRLAPLDIFGELTKYRFDVAAAERIV
jgi:hypothetical protein